MKTILVLCLAWGILAAEEADSEKVNKISS